MRTCESKECQSIRTDSDISRDDRVRITTCSLRTVTDIFKENYSTDVRARVTECNRPTRTNSEVER